VFVELVGQMWEFLHSVEDLLGQAQRELPHVVFEAWNRLVLLLARLPFFLLVHKHYKHFPFGLIYRFSKVFPIFALGAEIQ
jgi:hypothetical protein